MTKAGDFDKRGRQAGAEAIEITSEMIEAGVSKLLDYQACGDSAEEAVKEILSEALQVCGQPLRGKA